MFQTDVQIGALRNVISGARNAVTCPLFGDNSLAQIPKIFALITKSSEASLVITGTSWKAFAFVIGWVRFRISDRSQQVREVARIARFVVPGMPHHITQRGSGRTNVFHSPEDYLLYLDLLSGRCQKEGVEIWSYCLMPDHVHLILTPSTSRGLGLALGETHRRYSSVINARLRTSGRLFRARYSSIVLDEDYVLAAAHYGATNPVRAKLVARAEDWRWSSVAAHLSVAESPHVCVAPLLARCEGRFAELIESLPDCARIAALRAAETIGRPLGSEKFLDMIATITGRDARPSKRGPKRKSILAQA